MSILTVVVSGSVAVAVEGLSLLLFPSEAAAAVVAAQPMAPALPVLAKKALPLQKPSEETRHAKKSSKRPMPKSALGVPILNMTGFAMKCCTRLRSLILNSPARQGFPAINPSLPNPMTQLIPTVESMLDATRISHRVHRWPTEGGLIDVAADVLRPALEAAYDSTMTNWPAMVEINA